MKIAAFFVCPFFCSFIGLVTASQSLAAGSTCVEKYEIFDNNTQVQVLESGSKCFVSVHPRDAFEDMIYRDYMFDSEGLFMIFDSYGDGNEAQTTAAREFFFFPRRAADLSYKYDANSKRLMVTTVSGKVFVFNTEKAALESISGSEVEQNFTVKPENKGGLEILKNDGLYMDGGFERGQSPSQDPKGSVTFKDMQDHSCQLRNNDVYKYDASGEGEFKHSDAGLKSFLTSRCPQLKF